MKNPLHPERIPNAIRDPAPWEGVWLADPRQSLEFQGPHYGQIVLTRLDPLEFTTFCNLLRRFDIAQNL